MRSVRLNFLLMFFLTFGLSYQGYADCSQNVTSNTDLESFFAGWGEWRKEISVIAIKDQGVDGYFNPKIKVCGPDKGEKYPEYCHELYSGTSCRKIYGTQDTGAGISAMVFIDWAGDKTSVGAKIADDLGWEWAEGVTDEEKKKFANSPKICACSQKGACRSGFVKWWDKPFSAVDYSNLCDTCYQTAVKCAPVPLAPSPPPFCEQLAMSSPQVRIVPITDKDNDYFNPKVKVIAGDLIEEDGKIGKELDFPRKYKKDKAGERPTSDEVVREYSILDKDGTTHYFATYREKDKLCAEYRGTQSRDEKNPQFVRCFPAPPAPEPEVVEIVKSNTPGKQSDTLKIRMKMNKSACTDEARGTYRDGLCTFNVNTAVNIGPLSLEVVKPAIVAKTTDSNIDNIIEGILESNPQQFKVLKEYGYVPDVQVKCSKGGSFYSLNDFEKKLKDKSIQCEFNNSGQPEIEVKYKGNSNSKMLCLSGWQPEPEEFVLKREKIIPLKLKGTRYTKYNAVYSKESNRFYYLPSKEIVDPLKRPQDRLDKIIFNKQGYVFFPDDNKQEKGKCSYCVKRNDEIDDAFKSSKGLKVVYKLTDVEHREKCNQGDDGCICSDGKCSRSKQYLNKNENDKQFYLRYEEVDCKDKDGKVLRDEKNEVQKCTQLKDQLIKADRTEVFYADKLCRLDLKGLEENLEKIIKKQLKYEEQKPGGSSQISCGSENNVCTGDFSQYDYIEIEAWGGGEAGHIQNTAHFTESRPGIPGDYIKIKLKIDPSYPVIMAEIKQGGGNREGSKSDKNGESTSIKICDLGMNRCDNLITIAGGGTTDKTMMIHRKDLKLEEIIIKGNERQSTQDNQIAYIENGEIKYETVKCSSGFRSSKPGAGGCIDRNSQTYGRGSPGCVKIGSVQINYKKVKEVIDALIEDPESNVTVSGLIQELYPNIIEKIKEEIKKELLGLEPKDSKP